MARSLLMEDSLWEKEFGSNLFIEGFPLSVLERVHKTNPKSPFGIVKRKAENVKGFLLQFIHIGVLLIWTIFGILNIWLYTYLKRHFPTVWYV